MSKIFIGAKLALAPFAPNVSQLKTQVKKYPCTVIYINRPHRFFRVRFDFPDGYGFIESFKFITPEDRKGIRIG